MKKEQNNINDLDIDGQNIDQNIDQNHSENYSEEISAADTQENTLETLKQQLELLKQKADKNWDIAVRAKAELDNVRKRAELEVSNAHKYALDRFIPELFPLLDGLEQGLMTVPADQSFDSVRDGLTLSIKMFNDMLVRFGVEITDPANKLFDPNLHEAIAMQPAENVENGTVLIVVQKGYVLHKRVLRPARVIVAKK
ncbi:MAG: nucleotide exchange factor GrpE [Gammaproteobacteria bacterium]|nr:nucleotide exchange factor GrpE [Gammaproteobacteria bacterium]